MRARRTKTEFNQETINEYRREHGDVPIRMTLVAEWAIRTGRWSPPRGDLIRRCAEELADAAREETYIDPQGREVRKKYVARIRDEDGNQLYLWDDIETASPDHMRLSLSQTRRGILGDVIQHKRSTDSYNDNNKYGAQLKFSYNFEEDLVEMDQPQDYPDRPPGEVD